MALSKSSAFAATAAFVLFFSSDSAFTQPADRKLHLGNSYYGVDLELQSCARKGTQIQCSLTMTSNSPSAMTYTYTRPLATSKITDDEHIDHAQANGYFVVGKGKPADHATLVRGDTIEIVQVFNGADPDVKRVNLIIGGQYFSTDLN